ncbi:MAG: aminopeptidase P family protein [Acidisphaera sp.]|nr:aminopeptidase P family protein [Acidisphaera sp.]
MSKNDFAPQEFAERRARVCQAIGNAGLDWLLVIHPVSLHWLTGADTKSYTAFQCLPVSARPGRLVMFTRASERSEFEADTTVDEVRGWGGAEAEDPMEGFARLVDELDLRRARVGMEVPAWYLHPHHYVRIKAMLGEALVADPCTIVLDMKMVKSPREIDYVRESARIVGEAVRALIAAVAEGRSELALAAAAYQTLLASDSNLPASTINLVTGERCHFVLGGPTSRRLRRGDPGYVEVGAAFRRYTSTLGRAWSLGEPSARLREIHGALCQAAEACIGEIRAGAPATAPHEALKRVLAEAGLEQYRQHTSGYGMAPGFPPSWGEPVNMIGGSKYVLRAGMVISVEPGVYLPRERLGMRLIDNVLVTPTGCEVLSTLPRDLAIVR